MLKNIVKLQVFSLDSSNEMWWFFKVWLRVNSYKHPLRDRWFFNCLGLMKYNNSFTKGGERKKTMTQIQRVFACAFVSACACVCVQYSRYGSGKNVSFLPYHTIAIIVHQISHPSTGFSLFSHLTLTCKNSRGSVMYNLFIKIIKFLYLSVC